MIYYKEVECEEHMLFATEIAKIYNVYTKSNKAAASFVSAYLKEQMIAHGEEQLMYNTVKGLSNVYPARVYKLAMKELIDEITKANAFNMLVNMNAGGKNYNIIFRRQII